MGKLHIWGAGDIGERIISHLSSDWDIVFVDSKEQLVNSYYHEKRVISVKEYIENYSDDFILIAHLHEMESLEILHKHNIINYFVHSNLPGEFQEPCPREHLKKYVMNYLGNRKNFVLYGLDLYSIIIDDWLYERYGIHPYILVPSNMPVEFVKKIKNKFTNLKTIDDIGQLNNIEEICICTCDYRTLMDVSIFKAYQLTDIYDCSDKIEAYHNTAIERFHNIHKGKRCFIIATGPSLRIEDLNLLKREGELCISMNSIYHAFVETDWRPDYYMVFDYRELNAIKGIIDEWSIKANFVSNDSDVFWREEHNENVYCYHQTYNYQFDRLPEFSEDISRKCYMGGTVTYACLQLAVYMGFKEVYLLGVDFTNGSKKMNASHSHFYKEKNTGHNLAYIKQVFLAYQSAKWYADLHGIKIYNATRGGELEIFPRIDFDSLFK
ncbi:MAG: DUF115 domain-containing protein [Blautia sp.]|nr:DUF115 domain-containing protein [Blautia sp.]MCM1200788.1 DUF115 domain-containing protein [Bacteroides fragilis]